MPDLALTFLLVSCMSLAFQILALIRLARRRAGSGAEKLVGGGYLRTVTCRVLAAVTYVAVAAVQLAGSGTLSAEALTVWVAVQLLWACNTLLDIRLRRRLAGSGDGPEGRHARRTT